MKNIPTYEMLISDEMTDGVFGMSLVESPAVKYDYVLLSFDNKTYIELKLEKLADMKRHIVCGVALVPDMIIPRNGPDGEYNIVFSSETIRKISENFIINGNKDNVTLQHQLPVNDVYLVESWIVEDSQKDKSSVLGLNAPKGSWCISMKIKNDDIWNEYISSGVLKGFSLEGNFTQKEIKLEEVQICEQDELDDDILQIYLAITYTPADLDTYYKWEKSKNKDICPSCKNYDGEIFTLKEWCNKAIPGVKSGTVIAGITTSFPYQPFGTFCEHHCRCKLVKVQSPSFITKHIVKPW